MSKPAIRLIHQDADEGAARAELIRTAGYDVRIGTFDPSTIRDIRADPPDACIIDLSRTPSSGRDMGLRLRHHKATWHVPLVFMEGEPEKVARLRELIPDALYSDWKKLKATLREALSRPAAEEGTFRSGYTLWTGTPLVKKLGIRENYRLGLLNAPEEFGEILGELPPGATMHNGLDGEPDIIFWFIRSGDELRADIDWIAENIGRGGVWIAWPKKSAGYRTDLSQFVIRAICNEAGLADFKIASIDETWTGMRFARRRG